MGQNGFPDLDAAHISFRNISHHIAGPNGFPIGKGHLSPEWVNLRNCIALVLLHLLGNIVEIILHTQQTGLTFSVTMADFHLHTSHRRLLGRKDNLLQIKIAVRSTQVLDFKALDFYLLYQPLIECIQRIQHINQIMLFGMSSGIVEAKQRIKVFQSLLSHFTTHFLRLVQNQNRTVGLNDINRSAGPKFITFGIDDSRFLALAILLQRGRKRLGIDNHDIDPGTLGEIIQLVQIGAVINEEPCLFAVVFHKVVCGNLKGFFDSLPDCNGRHHHNKLAPAVLLVQLEHGFDIHIGFTGTGFHLDIQAATSQLLHQLRGEFDVVLTLDFLDIGKQLLIGQRHSLVLVAGIVEGICQLRVLTGTSQHRLIDRVRAFFA